MEILTILKANIKHHKGAFTSVILLLFIIALSFGVIISLNDNQKKDVEAANKLAKTGDYVVFIPDKQVDKDLFTKLKANKNVAQVEDRMGLSVNDAVISGKVSSNFIMVCPFEIYQERYHIFNDSADGFIKQPKISEGEVFVPLSYKDLFNCKKGDSLQIKSANGEKAFTIKGFMQEPYLGASVIGIKQVFICEQDYKRLSEMTVNGEQKEEWMFLYHMIHINQSKDSTLSLSEFIKNVNENTNLVQYSISLTREAAIEYTLMYTTILSGILYVFMILLFVIVLIVVGHSISTSVEMDYVDLGILKAQGFTIGKIRLLYILQYTIAGILGMTVGFISTYPVLSIFSRTMQPITGILASNQISLLKCVIVLACVLLLLIVFVFMKTRKVVKITPVRAISGGRESIYFDSRIKMPIRKKGLSGWMAMRQFTSAKRQYIGTILIVSILVFFMMAITILTASMTPKSIQELFGGVVGDVEVDATAAFSMEDIEAFEKEIQKITDITSSIYIQTVYCSLDDTSYHVTIYDKPEEMASIISGRAPRYDNEIVITEIVADELGKTIGDVVKVGYQDAEEEYLIAGIFQSTSDVGKCFAMSLEGMHRLDSQLQPSFGVLSLEKKECVEDVVTMLNDKFKNVLTAKMGEESNYMYEMVQVALCAVTVLIYIISIIFALVVVKMVCGKTFLKEKRDIGIYKALGFTTWNLRLQFAVRFLIVALMGSVIGVGFSVSVNDKMLSMLLRMMGVTKFRSEFTWVTLFMPSVLICVCFFLFAFLASGKVKKVDVRELIVE